MEEKESFFQNGTTWLRADFHLHTKADKEFQYDSEENSFVSAYVEALSKAGIRIGVITNHNKFDVNEFKALNKAARKQAIFLLPGVELSVNDGANGIHTLVVFSGEWLINGQDYINQFLNIAFEGKTPVQYENENGRSSLGLIDTIKKLEGYHKDFFLVFAHVEQKSGLWHELEGGRLQELGSNELFRRRTLGFQKVSTHDKSDTKCRVKVKSWLGHSYPAELEGCDAKNLEDIGKEGKACYLKIGAFSFDAVKFALMDYSSRVKDVPPTYQHSHIRQIHFEGGTLAGQTIRFSPELNALIGIRGSGKSSILEVLRYVLDIPFGEKAGDQKYKQELVGFTLGSGGKVVMDAVDRNGQLYQIRRIWKETPNVFIDNKLQPGVSIRETVLHKPIYFGQKDLSNTGEGFEKDLVEKLLGSKLDDIRRKVADQKNKVSDAVDRLLKITNVEEQMAEQTKKKLDTEHRLEFYKTHGVEEKLQKRLDFDADIRKMKEGVDLIIAFLSGLKELLAEYEDDLRNYVGFKSKHNDEAFKGFETVYAKAVQSLNNIKTEALKSETTQIELSSKYQALLSIREGFNEEFAEIERKLAEELKTSTSHNISSDEFLHLKQQLAQANMLLNAFSKQGNQKVSISSLLAEELQQLNDLWHEEFRIIKTELDKIGNGNSALAILLGYKEDKSAFLNFMKTIFKGSGIRETTFQGVVDHYSDFIAIYNDFENAKKLFGSNPQIMADIFTTNLKTLLTYQTPNKFTITYRGKELEHHSLGQRASALILFVLSQQENDAIIIDQPEDDLDNQTIYEDVIKLVRAMKPKVQFIFATHNPNIPVLGDAEQIHACSFMDNAIVVQTGSIDDPRQQKTIVDIMEGGKEAFNRRKEIYQIWKP
ncbi:MAG: histidinol-phosphatase [Candidatus Methylumidiphilus alinenensis]|uniref:Histidinol-phosphatase n=1 Tax=Candidatus Methylumidiphilus alinenensis TaxID=2202197 RepID=A0A2W4QHM9_9GAMM|nr:MAG: histidinol-phosphatase [Candidatus Methylumidiphilus alinenensis]